MQPTPQRLLWGIVLAAGEGNRTREFLAHLCGGRGIKQFCAVTGRRSMLQHTLDRVQQVIPRDRIVVIVSADHRDEVRSHLSSWPVENIIYQPRNRDTAPGILLPLAHISHRDPLATVAIFPSDHYIQEEGRFMGIVRRAAREVERFPQDFILLGITPEKAEEGYGWIEPHRAEAGRATRGVQRFWEKPDAVTVRGLLARGALWNSFVCVAWAPTVWHMVRDVAPDVVAAFTAIRRALGTPSAPEVIERAYATLRAVNFSSGVCEPLVGRLRVLPVPDVGWSDWGSAQRIRDSLAQLGKLDECLARLRHYNERDPRAFPLSADRQPSVRFS
ncbi:MAG: sugar phosphate nucleotidyltransferase [Candidatus Binatia bacterium]